VIDDAMRGCCTDFTKLELVKVQIAQSKAVATILAEVMLALEGVTMTPTKILRWSISSSSGFQDWPLTAKASAGLGSKVARQ